MAITGSDEKPALIDTSVWIAFFRKDKSAFTRVSDLIDSDRVCCAHLILAELIQGAKSEKEVRVLRGFIDVFPFLAESEDTWEKAGYTAFKARKKGKTIGLADCYLAQLASENRTPILSYDKHFKIISSFIPIEIL
jgi:predicted nucleic acid-binding protein